MANHFHGHCRPMPSWDAMDVKDEGLVGIMGDFRWVLIWMGRGGNHDVFSGLQDG